MALIKNAGERGKLESNLIANGRARIVGVDEAGRGPCAGPIVAAAVELKDIFDPLHSQIVDSKKLSERKREELFDYVIQSCAQYSIVEITSQQIDEFGLHNMNRAAMIEAVSKLEPGFDVILIDGYDFAGMPNTSPGASVLSHHVPALSTGASVLSNDVPVLSNDVPVLSNDVPVLSHDVPVLSNDVPVLSHDVPVLSHGVPVLSHGVWKGDSSCISIAAASILAKVTRDRIMHEFDEIYPQYGFGSHKGYSSVKHMQAIATHGVLPIHRKSFANITPFLTV